MIDFPNSPTVGQQFSTGGVTWVWDGAKWTPTGLNQAFVPLSGGTMTGPLILSGDPTVPLGAVDKQYVDVRPIIGDNRIINGDMRIDQRNNGASGTASGYTVDRWQYYGAQASKGAWGRTASNGASGFPYCLSFSSSSAYTPAAGEAFQFSQAVEADMVSDFAWGTANAQPVTLSFLVASSLTGTFSGAIYNYAATRFYPFSFSLPTASAWTKIVITIPGDTAGTWVMSGNVGAMILAFNLGAGSNIRGPVNAWTSTAYYAATGAVNVVGTNGATFYVTGVKLEIGSVATPFNRQSLAKSMADCQRYYQVGLLLLSTYESAAGAGVQISTNLPVAMRAVPTLTSLSTTNSNISGFSLTAGGATNAMVWAGGTATAIGNTTINCTVAANAEL